MPRLLTGLLAGTWLLFPPSDLRAGTITLGASLDATLIEHPAGALANGAGPALFVGRTSQASGARRRALLFFDVAAALPRGASVESVELMLALTPSHDPVEDVFMHRVLSGWSEGPSSASGGGGAPALPGDSTWLHTEYPTQFWSVPGGDHVDEASAVAAVGEPGAYVWASTPALVADVQDWLDEPASNHGWLLIGDEAFPSTVKRFASREDPADEARPRLRVVYRVRCEDAALPPGALGLCRAYCEALDCDEATAPPERACAQLAEQFRMRSGGAEPPCE